MWQGIPQSNSPRKKRMLELSCPAVNISQLLDMRMPAVVSNARMERGIQIVDNNGDHNSVVRPTQKLKSIT